MHHGTRLASPQSVSSMRLLAHLARRSRLFHSSPALLKTQEFLVAAVGEGISEVEIMEWYVKPGDTVDEFDKVCDVQTDKATVEITSRFAGTIKSLNYNVGDAAKVGSSLVTMDVSDDATDAAEAAPVSAEEAKSISDPLHIPSRKQPTPSDKVLTTPAVRRIARENNVDLSLITATGPNGRLLKHDVLQYLDRDAVPVQTTATAFTEDTVVPVSGLQRVMVKTMTAAASVPSLGLCDDIVMNELVEIRASLKEEAAKQGIKLSYLPFMIKATSLALGKFPIVNSWFETGSDSYTMKGAHNIGLAMDSPRGLIVPNIKNIQSRSILEIASELNRLQSLAMESKLGQEDLRDGTFTLSNIGTISGTYASPILFVPQVVIGALGRLDTVPRYDTNGNIVKTSVMPVSWTADHRIIDGATIGRFSKEFKRYLETPSAMLLELK